MPETPRTHHDEANAAPGKGAIVNPATKHETSDVNVKALLGFVVVFLVFAVITHIVLYLLFHRYKAMFSTDTNQPLTAIERPAGADVPEEPRLQPFKAKDAKGTDVPPTAATPVIDMETMRHNEEEALNHPGWVDQKAGRVRLPIDLAKQIVVQRGLPVNGAGSGASGAPGAPASPLPGTTPATSSSTTIANTTATTTGGATH